MRHGSSVAILTTTKTWRAAPLARTRAPDLTDEERAYVRRALAFLAVQAGGLGALAHVVGLSPIALRRFSGATGRRPTAGLAVRLARAAKQPVDSILGGEWPPEGACPHCGRG